MPSPRVVPVAPLLLLVALVAACGSSGSTTAGTSPVGLDDGIGGESGQAAAPGDDPVPRLTAALRGDAEVPGPGDPDASGRATVVLQPERSELCYRIEVEGVTGVDGTSVHEGAEGQQGAVVLGLDRPEGGSVEGCVTAERELLERIARSPEDHYLNVRSEEHPDGAVRGQLTAPRAS